MLLAIKRSWWLVSSSLLIGGLSVGCAGGGSAVSRSHGAVHGHASSAEGGVFVSAEQDAAQGFDGHVQGVADSSDVVHGAASAAHDAASSQSDAADARPTDAAARADDSAAADADAGNVVRPSWLIDDGAAVFFVGNSFFDAQNLDLPDWVAAVGQAVSPKITIKTGSHIVAGNNPLQWFFQQQQSQDAIASKKYKVFILQGEEFEPVDHKQQFQDAVRAYYHAVTASGGSVMLFMTWDFKWDEGQPAPTFLDQLSSAYDEIGKELHIPVIPVGLIYDDVNNALPPGEVRYFLNGGSLHQTEKGTAVNAYATFSMLTGINPKGASFAATGNTNSPTLLQYLSDKSWARVAPRLHN
ncbi:MAG TPA: hypothetical protein VF331_05395 [Polyangiales bacterium]